MEKEIIKHESFGLAGFSRSTIGGGGGVALFGSSILHNNTIRFRVYHAEVNRSLAQDWYHTNGRTPIIEIEMSETQFGTMISSMNVGDGHPVTIRSIDKKQMEPCPYENKRLQSANEFKKRMREYGDRVDSYKLAMLKKVEKLPKKDQEEIKNMIEMLSQEVRSNIPFFEDQFTRQMNKTITEAKGEVEAFVQNKIVSTGIAAIKEQGGFIQLPE